MSPILAAIPAGNIAVMPVADRPYAHAWNTLLGAAERRAGAPLRWTQQGRGWGELTVEGATRDTVYGVSASDAMRRFVGSP